MSPNGTVMERNHFYPSGLRKSFTQAGPGQGSPVLVQGERKQAWVPGMHWVNYGTRQYDPVLMRFHGVDGAPQRC